VTGNVQFAARDYDPTTGVWTQADPLGLGAGDLNDYQFANGNPVNATDPTGLWSLGGALSWAWTVSSAAVGSVGTGLYNVGVGAAHTVWDVVAVPVDIVGTTVSSNWTPQSYYGESTQTAMRSGLPFWQYGGEGALNGGTLGAWGYGKGAYNWSQTGDPTVWQQSAGGFATGLILTAGALRAGASSGRVTPEGEVARSACPATSAAGVRAPVKGIGKLTGFSDAEAQMIANSEKALQGAGYDTSLFRELVRADMPKGYRGMSLEEGAALGQEAFSAQEMLNHVLEEELIHLQQKAAGLGEQFGPGTAQGLEEAADAARIFPEPK